MKFLELGDLFSVFTRAHVADGTADCDGPDLETSQSFAETQPFVVGAGTAHRILEQHELYV